MAPQTPSGQAPARAPGEVSNQPSAPVIVFEDVHAGYGEDDILRGLSFSVASHETRVLVGESGSGKTLMLKIAAGLLRPTSGRVFLLGQDLDELSEHEMLDFRRKIGFVFQEGALFDSISVGENVAYLLREANTDEDEIEGRVREALSFVEMEDTMEKMPADLSGGMRRRVSIARALIARPEVVFYDSPTAGLDPLTSETIITLLLRLRDLQGVTALLATHRLQDAFGMANYRFDKETNRVIHLEHADTNGNYASETEFLFLREGRAYFQGTPQALLDSGDPYLKRFLV
ncbi:MAG TPA: ATP-binding cassette domain-containing protein [Candidatus Acidoferrales bacterium]|jgi:phospholipid/cholesterol/gamma-HCH transport system ATP-binding protein|nr:ATP-binding cassette domain-containing protein [Candidatus Acidoferrales bacterium]